MHPPANPRASTAPRPGPRPENRELCGERASVGATGGVDLVDVLVVLAEVHGLEVPGPDGEMAVRLRSLVPWLETAMFSWSSGFVWNDLGRIQGVPTSSLEVGGSGDNLQGI